jgi:hypothetical protein
MRYFFELLIETAIEPKRSSKKKHAYSGASNNTSPAEFGYKKTYKGYPSRA